MRSDRELYALRFRYAVELCGDERTLASILNVPRGAVRRWQHGVERPPTAIFLAVVNLLLGRRRPELRLVRR